MPTDSTATEGRNGPQTLHPCPGGRLGIVSAADAHRLVSLCSLAAGETILWVDGRLTSQPSRHSLQVGADTHVAPVQGSLDEGFWRYLNHSCEPNAWLRGRELITLRPMQVHDDVTFDYHTTEWDLSAPFACGCGSTACVGTVRGFAHLSAAQRDRLHGVAPHLLARVASTPA